MKIEKIDNESCSQYFHISSRESIPILITLITNKKFAINLFTIMRLHADKL